MTGHYTGINICDGARRGGGREGGRGEGSSTKAATEEEQENRCQNGESSIGMSPGRVRADATDGAAQ